MTQREIPYYLDYLSPNLLSYLQRQARPVGGVPQLCEIGEGGGLESAESLAFVCELYDLLKDELCTVLSQRALDRQFIDQRTRACYALNQSLKIDFHDSQYATVISQEDRNGRIVVGPKNEFYCRRGDGVAIAPLPDFLQGSHVTLFGPPDDAKLSINAMNAFHRKLPNEPAIVEELLTAQSNVPKWGADDEDSKTPLRRSLIAAGQNLAECYTGALTFTDPQTGKSYAIERDRRALPIKRFPGLALPCLFFLYRDNPLPLHIYDFALHLFQCFQQPSALSFYVPKLETVEEAKYIHKMVAMAEQLLQKRHPTYQPGTVRLFIVLENPRAIFAVHEFMDALYPYFAGASLGWHDYLASTARLFKEDGNYRIPVKADPEIVIKHIQASHHLLAEVVGSRQGIKIGGMYGVLPVDTNLHSPSFQIAIKGFIKDVITQLKRDLSGFWVAHPDFVRIGLALVEGWRLYQSGNRDKLQKLVTALLAEKYHHEILEFIDRPDIVGLDLKNPLYPRSLIVADIKESNYISNHHPEEIRYNVFQSLQYLADWLSGNGCVALPAQIADVPVRIMDDLATAERSRWEVWHELHYQRFSIEDFLKIVHEELLFIRKDLSNSQKIVQVKWNERTAKWYPIALRIMIQLMTAEKPVEFATELLLPFTIEAVRAAEDPWAVVQSLDSSKYALLPYIERFHEYFAVCGSVRFARTMAELPVFDSEVAERLIRSFSLDEVIEAANFHGDIGQSPTTLDASAAREQSLVIKDSEAIKAKLRTLGAEYRQKFGVKFLISARDKSAPQILAELNRRLLGTAAEELENGRSALWEISQKRLQASAAESLKSKIETLRQKHGVTGAMVSISKSGPSPSLFASPRPQTLCFGAGQKGTPVTAATFFELASLSKTLASCFALEYFAKRKIPLGTSVNALLARTSSSFRLRGDTAEHSALADQVSIAHLLSHCALNMHYVNGVPADQEMPNVHEFLDGNERYAYPPVRVIGKPGQFFQYSGGGFLVLEHLLESLEGKSIFALTAPFFAALGLKNLTFEQRTLPAVAYASGYLDDGSEVVAGRKMFPALAAGAMGTTEDFASFLHTLTRAYTSVLESGPISHETAVNMLYPRSTMSREFMAADIGLGVFIVEAGPNRLALHQGANDGFRGLFVHCFAGPDCGKGFVILCNAEFHGILFIAEVAQALLRELKISGVDMTQFRQVFEKKEIPQAEVVNQAYKNLIFASFLPDLPEAIVPGGARDPLADFNLAEGGTISHVSNQRFARAENLLSGYLPRFVPDSYGRQGKIMDSWETARHNHRPCDELIFRLKKPSAIRFVTISTQFHLGNHAEQVMIEGRASGSTTFVPIVSKMSLLGHAQKHVLALHSDTVFADIKVSLYPDGGLTRLGLYGDDLPVAEQPKFQLAEIAKSIPFAEKIPHTVRPLAPRYDVTAEVIERNWARFAKDAEVNLADAALGAKIVQTTNEHYGPAAQLISPFPPLDMFDGFESARSRTMNHREEVVVALAKPGRISRIEIDFSYFKNNNPRELSIIGLGPSGEVTLVEKAPVKAFAGNTAAFWIHEEASFHRIKLIVYPDGGMNRLRVFGRASERA